MKETTLTTYVLRHAPGRIRLPGKATLNGSHCSARVYDRKYNPITFEQTTHLEYKQSNQNKSAQALWLSNCRPDPVEGNPLRFNMTYALEVSTPAPTHSKWTPYSCCYWQDHFLNKRYSCCQRQSRESIVMHGSRVVNAWTATTKWHWLQNRTTHDLQWMLRARKMGAVRASVVQVLARSNTYWMLQVWAGSYPSDNPCTPISPSPTTAIYNFALKYSPPRFRPTVVRAT